MDHENNVKTSQTLRRINYDDLEFDDQQALIGGVPFTGIVFSLYQNDALEYEMHYRDELPEGLQQGFYPNGGLKEQWFAIWSKGSSESFEYHPDGGIKSYWS
jgi:antitoxin component YwqK of YwqJK toxin-antitoxin module